MRKNLIASAVALAFGVTSIAAHADVNTVVGGTMFVDFTNIDQTSKGKDTAAAGTGLDVKRFYLTVDHKFDDFWSANLTTDFQYQSTLSNTNLYVKKAYLQGKWSSEFAVRVGSDDNPWIGFVDSLSGLRYVENSMVDRLSNYGNSADWGIHVLGNAEDGFWNYNFAVINGGGYKNPTRSSTVDVEGRVGIQPIKGLMLAIGGYSGEFGKDVETNNQQTPVVQTRGYTRGDALIAYNTADLRVGAEYFTAHNNKNNVSYTITNPATGARSSYKDKADGYSLWGWYSFMPNWAVIARYDNAKPLKDTDSSRENEYGYAGIEWTPRKGIKIAGLWKHTTVQNDLKTTNDKTDEIGVWAEVKF